MRWAFMVVLLVGCVDLARPGVLVSGGDAAGGGNGSPGGPSEPLPDGAVGPLLKTNGDECALNAECPSNRCVDGVCCNEACNGTCLACNTAASRGWCAPVPAGLDPADECATDAPATCRQDGSCDGRGACRHYPAGASCAAAVCQGASAMAESTCDGAGTCVAGGVRACASGMCTAGVCVEPCTSNANCQSEAICEAGRCQPKRPTGAACTSGAQCATSFCADGVCCDSACTQQCSACNLVGSLGSCTPIPAGQDPASECPSEASSTCGRRGGCDGGGGCQRYAVGTICRLQSCTGNNVIGAGQCSATGACVTPAPVSCGAYTCTGNACATTCSSSSQCTGSNVCSGSSCVGPCVSESTSAFCKRLGRNCGTVSGTDNCGAFRWVSSCGSCSPPQYCNGGGQNVCGGNASPCAQAYTKSKCTTYLRATRVSRNGRNWSCITHDCANCAASDLCAPGVSGCPWGNVWQDEGVCL